MLHRHFSHHAIGFQIIFRLVGLVGHGKGCVAGCDCETVQRVSARFVMFCVNIMSDGIECFFLSCCVSF